MHVLVKVHHLKAIELLGDCLDLLLLSMLDFLHAFGIPICVRTCGLGASMSKGYSPLDVFRHFGC